MSSILGKAAAGAAALSLSIAAVVVLGGSASARPAEPSASRATAVTLGATTNVPLSCQGGSTTVQYEDTGSPSYRLPAAGVITSFSYYANNAGQVRAVLMGPSATVDHKTLVGSSPAEAVTAGSLQTFQVRIPAPAGAVLGIWNSQNDMGCWGVAPTADRVVIGHTFNPATDTDFSGSDNLTNAVANISAVWEPDADHDGFGDVSQDLCPQSAATQAACVAPDTKVTKQPRKASSKRKVKIVFSAAAGSTFTCAVDKAAPKPCTSPFKKKLKPGKHKVVITATSAQGVVEAAPATVKFKILRPH